MPAAACLYDLKANIVHEFGCAHRNTITFSPHGRFVCLAGFGNLAGEMDFWDLNKKKKMGKNTSHCAVGAYALCVIYHEHKSLDSIE